MKNKKDGMSPELHEPVIPSVRVERRDIVFLCTLLRAFGPLENKFAAESLSLSS
jgi:hypothetical protein